MASNKRRVPTQELRNILSANILRFRESRGLSQEAFADMCGMHRTYLGSVERCERNVTLSTLEIFAKALGVTVPMLLTEQESSDDDKF